ncbi:MAG: hypothetical protein MJ180_03645 [Candidatus Gastranaerophilales bacterium]|nr:hypothetical protein [Candidatus Gastranaerophilales bacterium]
MKVSAINFKGMYIETKNDKTAHKTVGSELKGARPFLKQLARVLPGDLHVKVYNGNDGNTHLDVDYFIPSEKESYNLVKTNEHLLKGNGFWLLSDVFCGLEKYDEKLFEDTAKNFVKNFDRIKIYPD